MLGSNHENNPLYKKVQKVLEINLLEDKELQDSLLALSHFYRDNSLENRRHLRSDIENKNLALSINFLDSFKEIKGFLDAIDSNILDMSEYCDKIGNQIKTTKIKTNEIMNEAKKLMSEKEKLDEKSIFVKMFFDKYMLKPEELKKISTGEIENIDEEYLNIVSKIIRINSHDATESLGQYGLEGSLVVNIRAENASNKDKAIRRLGRWAKDECRLLTGDNVFIKPLLKRSLQIIKTEPINVEIYQELTTARSNCVNNLFINALTQEGPGGVPKPIELHAHDPLRYVGDMLAWVHQFTMSENELLSTFTAEEAVPTDFSQPRAHHNGALDDESNIKMSHILSGTMEGILRPLKIRIEQILISESKEVILYKLGNVIQFYVQTFLNYLPPRSPFIAMLKEMEQLDRDKLVASLAVYARKIGERNDKPSQDLYPTSYFNYLLSIAKDMLSAKSSFMTTIDPESKDEFSRVVESLINPMVETIKMSSQLLQNPLEQSVYQLNCFHNVYHGLKQNFQDKYSHDFVTNIENQLNIPDKLDQLAHEQGKYVLSKTGMLLLHDKIFVVSENTKKIGSDSSADDLDASQDTSLSLDHFFGSCLVLFDQYLSAPDLYIIPEMLLVQDVDFKDHILDKSQAIILDVYTRIYTELTKDSNAEKDYVKILSPFLNQLKTPKQIAELL